MGKYMRKAKATGEVAVMEVSQASLGVRTRAKTLALQRLQQSSVGSSGTSGSYLQLRSRRLEKPPKLAASHDSKKQRQIKCMQNQNPNPNSWTSSILRVEDSATSGSVGCLSKECGQFTKEDLEAVEEEDHIQEKENNCINIDVGIEASFGENVTEFEGRERSTRESTPCSLIRDPDSVKTPGSTTKRTNASDRRIQNSMQRPIPTAHEMDEFFAGAEEKQQKLFIDKYNFDPVNDKPLLGRYEWVKLNL